MWTCKACPHKAESDQVKLLLHIIIAMHRTFAKRVHLSCDKKPRLLRSRLHHLYWWIHSILIGSRLVKRVISGDGINVDPMHIRNLVQICLKRLLYISAVIIIVYFSSICCILMFVGQALWGRVQFECLSMAIIILRCPDIVE